MTSPDRLIGFIEYDDTEFPFELDKEKFRLKLYPPTVEEQRKRDTLADIIELSNNEGKRHAWIPHIKLYGTSAGGSRIVVSVNDMPEKNRGFITFRVHWYFYGSMDDQSISGFRVAGKEVGYFYNAYRVLKPEVKFAADYSIEHMGISSDAYKQEQCGKYRVAKGIDASVSVEAHSTIYFRNADTPIDAKSDFVTTFSSPCNLDVLLKAYWTTKAFFKYITYRSNISFTTADVFAFDENGKRRYDGILVFPPEEKEETDKRASERIISFSILGKHSADLLRSIKNLEIESRHLCTSIDEQRHYPPSRIIMTLACFESEFRLIYGVDIDRSQVYVDTKNEVANLIDGYANSWHGRKRTYAKQLRKYVQNRDSSFESNLHYALLECQSIMRPFVLLEYNGPYGRTIRTIAERMGTLRNGIAHNKINYRLDAVHLADIRVVEQLTYAMRLKKILKCDSSVQKAIKALFGVNIYLECEES